MWNNLSGTSILKFGRNEDKGVAEGQSWGPQYGWLEEAAETFWTLALTKGKNPPFTLCAKEVLGEHYRSMSLEICRTFSENGGKSCHQLRDSSRQTYLDFLNTTVEFSLALFSLREVLKGQHPYSRNSILPNYNLFLNSCQRKTEIFVANLRNGKKEERKNSWRKDIVIPQM